MAIRSGAGTGVIVSLVVFVLATVFLLVLSIVFYVGNREQIETVEKAEAHCKSLQLRESEVMTMSSNLLH